MSVQVMNRVHQVMNKIKSNVALRPYAQPTVVLGFEYGHRIDHDHDHDHHDRERTVQSSATEKGDQMMKSVGQVMNEISSNIGPSPRVRHRTRTRGPGPKHEVP